MQVFKSLILTEKRLYSPIISFVCFCSGRFIIIRWNIGQKVTSEAIYLLVNIFTVEVFLSVIIYKQHIFLGQICLQEFLQSEQYPYTFKHCLYL